MILLAVGTCAALYPIVVVPVTGSARLPQMVRAAPLLTVLQLTLLCLCLSCMDSIFITSMPQAGDVGRLRECIFVSGSAVRRGRMIIAPQQSLDSGSQAGNPAFFVAGVAWPRCRDGNIAVQLGH